ncbi:unnamed protein product, partial [Cladocopium goreaui]
LQKPLADPSVGFVGSVLSSVELTLHSEYGPEITDNDGKPYLCTDKVHSDGSACCGRGEIWMRGNSIGSGYYKLPEQTAAWFHSGDIGLITPEGKVKIIDRKKNLVAVSVKLEGGEHVALELINVTYNNHELVNADAGGVCSFASHEIDLPVLLAQCNLAAHRKKKELLALAAANGVGEPNPAWLDDFELLMAVMAAVKTALDAVAKESPSDQAHKLPALMQAIAVMPVLEPWTEVRLVAKKIYQLHEKVSPLGSPFVSLLVAALRRRNSYVFHVSNDIIRCVMSHLGIRVFNVLEEAVLQHAPYRSLSALLKLSYMRNPCRRTTFRVCETACKFWLLRHKRPIGRPSIIWPNAPRFRGQKFSEYIMVHQMSCCKRNDDNPAQELSCSSTEGMSCKDTMQSERCAETKVEKSGPVVAFLFKLAMRIKKSAVRQNRYTPLFDLLVFKKFKSMLGGCMKFTLSGGGAISPDVQEWVRTAFGCPLIQGYGLTETCGGAVPEITDNDGKPYLCTGKVHSDGSACCGRGEIWMRGNSIGSGYYKLPEQTAADFDNDGWHRALDVVKLKGGEYVALELINVTYNNHELINADAGGVCSFASHEIDRPVLLAQCNLAAHRKKKELLALAAANGVGEPRMVMAAVKTALDAVAKAHKLLALMQAIAVMPVLEPWTPGSSVSPLGSPFVSLRVAALRRRNSYVFHVSNDIIRCVMSHLGIRVLYVPSAMDIPVPDNSRVTQFWIQSLASNIRLLQLHMLHHLQLSFETSLLMAAASSNWNGYWQIPHAEKVPSAMDIPVPDNSRVMQFSIQPLASNIRPLQLHMLHHLQLSFETSLLMAVAQATCLRFRDAIGPLALPKALRPPIAWPLQLHHLQLSFETSLLMAVQRRKLRRVDLCPSLRAHARVAFLFKLAMRIKKSAVRQNLYTPLFDLLVFKKFESMLGGCMKFTLSGGGAISLDVQEWVRTAFGCPLIQ